MSEPSILLFAPAIDSKETARSLTMLRSITLPNTTKYFATNGQFDGQNPPKSRDVEALYPAALPFLRTLGTWAERSNPSDERFRDGYDLYCLRTILDETEGFDFALLLREVEEFDEQWPELHTNVDGQAFLTFAALKTGSPAPVAARNVIFDLGDRRVAGLVEAACELYFSGAAYAMPDYCLDDALATALHSMTLEDEINRPASE